MAVVSLVLVLASAIASARAQAVTTANIIEWLGVGPGSTVCEIGAGDGAFAIEIAKTLGPATRVYASELGEPRVKSLRAKLEAVGSTQVEVVEGAATATNFGERACDGIVLKDVYHHLTRPAAMNASMLLALKPGARIVIVDFTPPGAEAPRPEDRGKDGMHGVLPATVEHELRQAGFEVVPATAQPGGRWFAVVMARPQPFEF